MQTISVLRKRNGDIVPFEKLKISQAVKKAFIAVTKESKDDVAENIVNVVVSDLNLLLSVNEDFVPSVEHVQDLVEKALMKTGLLDVAKAYIVYRYEHQKKRDEKRAEDQEKLEESGLNVVFPDGHTEKFTISKIRATVKRASAGYEDIVNVEQIVNQLKLEVFDGISIKEVKRALIMVVRAMIEQDPAYSFIASRLVLDQIDEDLSAAGKTSHTDEEYRKAFSSGIKRGVERGLLDSRLADFDLAQLEKAIDPNRDKLFMFLGTQTLYERYLVRDSEGEGKIIENIQGFWMRVAMGIALAETTENRNLKAIEFYEVMSTHRFVPSSPTLFHSGTKHPQLSSCYLNTVEDSLEHIFKVYADNSQLSKWAGGIGTNWSSVRASGGLVKKSGIKSNGIVPFLKIANDVTVAINRSGRRRGATCVYLENWHFDVEEFLELRKNTGDDRRRTHDIDTALWISDLFMKRVRDDKSWTLLSPDECPMLTELYGKKFEEYYEKCELRAKNGELRVFKVIQARDLWRKMVTMLYETGHPWITFKDPSNVRSPQDHVGVVHNSNLCTEITLNNSKDETAVCNLGSLNYQRLMRDGKFDTDLVSHTVHIAMRMLDNVIDVNFYPTIEAKNSNMRHRPVGLGLMGYHDALYMMNIAFDSEEAVKFADESMEFVSYHAILASSMLAKERGAYGSYKGSKWERGMFPVDTIALLELERGEPVDVSRTSKLDWGAVRESVRNFGMRNSNTMALAPTATISNIVGSVPTIEPIYKNIYVKANMNGDFIIINHYLVNDLKKIGLWDFEMIGKLKYNDGSIANIVSIPIHIRDKYKEVFEISTKWLLRQAAVRSKWIDQSQSLNIYFAGTSGKELASLYEEAWRMGLKTTYYLRSLGASQVEKSTVNASEFGQTHKREASASQVTAQPMVSVIEPALQSSPVASAYNSVPETKATTFTNGAFKITAMPEATCDGCQ